MILSCSLHAAAIATAVGVAVQAGRRPPTPLPQVRIETAVASSPASAELPPLPAIVVEITVDEPPSAEVSIELPSEQSASEREVPVDTTRDPREPSFVPPMLRLRAAAAMVPPASVSPAAVVPPAPAPSEVPPATSSPAAAAHPQVDAEPRADNPPPNFPEDARRRGQQGSVVVAVTVDAAGLVVSASLQTPSPHVSLNREALRAVRSWRFEPARRDGQAVATTTEVVIEFRLEQAASPR